MRRNNKKGFTIVELVIVIAVIAILAGVLIPTFASVVTKANESAALQEAQNTYKEVYALDLSDGKVDYDIEATDLELDADTFTYQPPVEDNPATQEDDANPVIFSYNAEKYTVTFDGTTWTATATPND